MNAVISILLRILVLVVLAPLLPGVVTAVKSWVAGRRGPSVEIGRASCRERVFRTV